MCAKCRATYAQRKAQVTRKKQVRLSLCRVALPPFSWAMLACMLRVLPYSVAIL